MSAGERRWMVHGLGVHPMGQDKKGSDPLSERPDPADLRAARVVAGWRGAVFRGRWPPLRLRRLKANSYPFLKKLKQATGPAIWSEGQPLAVSVPAPWDESIAGKDLFPRSLRRPQLANPRFCLKNSTTFARALKACPGLGAINTSPPAPRCEKGSGTTMAGCKRSQACSELE